MDAEAVVILDYVRKHPYRSIKDIAAALGIPAERAERILRKLHDEWNVYVLRDHFVPEYGFVPYESPLVEPESDSK